MPALISTIALIAGCGSNGRVEVSGVVRDRTTGRAIAGARVVGTDGSATRTDASGRFTLSLARGGPAVVRASARDHDDVTAPLDDVHAIDLGLSPAAAPSADDPDSVVRYLQDEWVDDALRWSRDHALDAPDDPHDETLAIRAAIALLGGSDGEHAGLECGACHAPAPREGHALRALESDLDTSRCVGCHEARPDVLVRDRDGDGRAATVAVELETVLARAGSAVDAALARAGIERCGRRAVHVSGEHLVDDAGHRLGDCDGSGAIDGSEVEVTLDVLPASLGALARELSVLRADGAVAMHAPASALSRAARIARDAAH